MREAENVHGVAAQVAGSMTCATDAAGPGGGKSAAALIAVNTDAAVMVTAILHTRRSHDP